MMTRRSAAASRVGAAPTGTASVAELIPSSSGIQRRKQGPGTEKTKVCYCCNRKGELAKSWRFCSTRPQKFSNARDSGLFIAFVAPLLLADELRDGPESGGELGRRLVTRAGKRYRHDFLHCSGPIRHHHNAVGEQQRLFDAVRHEHDGLLELRPDPEQFVLHRTP